MSRLSSTSRCLVAVGLAAAAAGVAAAPAAAASSLTLGYQCKIPLIGQVPVTAKYTLDAPASVRVGESTPAFAVTADLTLPAIRGVAQVVVPNSAQGEVKLDSTVTFPGGVFSKVKLPLQLPNTVFPAPGAVVQSTATGTYPSLVSDEPGTASITIDKLALNLRFLDVDGAPFLLPPAVTDIEGNPFPPSDNDPNTTDVSCKANAGQDTKAASIEILADTPEEPPVVRYSYDLAGTAGLKTLTKGTLPLKGGIDAALTLSTGAFSADLALAPTQGRLIAAGFLPVTAKIGFVTSGKTTGTLLDGVLESTSKVRIKVQEVKLFGAIPLAGGNNCQTKSLSEIKLKSTDEFKPLQGGNIAGTFKISDLNGCGPLNGLVSPLTAGDGNTIALKLTPKAPAAS
ncbi:MAG: hypothetical protein JHD16_11815 [Solirubrobacteraceae bacterium]|nr:hypothetical protein [Solirubrobacteraceae bacterium]